MKNLFVCLTVVAAILMSPTFCMAYENLIDVGFYSESGTLDYTGGDADYSGALFGIGYTRFMSDLETDSEPYGAREFLQHPSYLSVSSTGVATEIDDNYSNDKVEDSLNIIDLGGMYYFNESTGVGAAFERTTGEEELSGFINYDVDILETEISFLLAHYPAENVRITAGYAMGSGEYEYSFGGSDDYDTSRLDFTVMALVDDITLGLEYEVGETDYDGGSSDEETEMELEAGYFFSQSLWLGASYYSRDTEDSSKSTILSLMGEVYLSEQARLRGEVYSGKVDYDSGWDELSFIGLGLQFGYYF